MSCPLSAFVSLNSQPLSGEHQGWFEGAVGGLQVAGGRPALSPGGPGL